MRNMKKIRFYFFYILAVSVMLSGLFTVQHLFACSTVVVGKNASTSGAVLFGHNEDDSGREVVNIWKVPRKNFEKGSFITLRGGAKIPQSTITWALTWVQIPGQSFSDYFINEWGVTIASDACPSREDKPEITDGGIGFYLRRIVAERAKSAREGVEIAGELLDKYGYNSSGRTLVICDTKEAWLLGIVAGKHWVAQRVPDDEAVFLPNVYVIRSVDFNDNENFIFSKHDIRKYAISRGWYNPDRDKVFDFAYIFMNKRVQGKHFEERGYDTRQWRGQMLLTGKKTTISYARRNGLPFSVKPNRKIGVDDIKRILRDHYEGTVYGPASNLTVKAAFNSKGKGIPRKIFVNPNFTTERTICTPTTQFSAIAELRNDVTPILGHLIWFCMGRPDCGVYVPLYVETIDFGQEFQNFPGITDPVKALQYHFNEPEGAYQYNSSKYFWICNDLENLTDMFYENCIDTVASAWSTFEQNVTNLQDDVEDTVKRLMKRDVNNAKLYLNQHSNFMINEAKSRTLMLIKKIKSDYYR